MESDADERGNRRLGERGQPWVIWRMFYLEKRKSATLLEGSQSSPSRPYDKGSVEAKS
jgi:hypothetical protein